MDDLVEDVIHSLEAHGLLDNTYVFFTSDNGYHIGQHRMVPGKGCPYEEDINIPMMVRGPGVPKGHSLDTVTSHTDIAATLFDLAGIPLRADFDGLPMPLSTQTMRMAERDPRREHVSVEYWGTNLQEGVIAFDESIGSPGECESLDLLRISCSYGLVRYGNNTYKAMRVIGDSYNLLYSVWCTNEHELYDMTVRLFHNQLKPMLITPDRPIPDGKPLSDKPSQTPGP